VTARLSHPNIVQIFDFSKFDDEYFFAMEYVNGIDLRKALQLCRQAGLHWPANLVMRVISDVCAGLEAAHEYTTDEGVKVPIYHRDVSPENILISVDGAVKLTDFGIAKTADSSVNTDSGVFKGKHAYSAPEQLEAGTSSDHRSDIYATGIVMFETLALRRYLGDEPTMSMAYAASKQPPPILASERDAIPEGLQAIFERATAPDAEQRYQTAFELRDGLETLMKQGEYASSHDLAAWIRKVMALDTGAGDSPQHTPGFQTADTRPRRVEGSASERALTAKARTLRTAKQPKATDDDG
jgi:serine/threonine-protein kinase